MSVSYSWFDPVGHWTDGIVDPLENDEITVDFKPLYQCIHIYDALESKTELQRSYQQDRKVSYPARGSDMSRRLCSPCRRKRPLS